MRNKKIGVRKYIPSRSVRLHNNLIFASYGMVLAFALGLFGFIHHTDVQIAKMDAELEELHRTCEAERIASEEKVREAEEKLDAQAKMVRQEIEEEYFIEMEEQAAEQRIVRQQLELEKKEEPVNSFNEPTLIRCTGYCVKGTTASGEYTRDGIVAGKREWLGKRVALFSVSADGNIGELIGEYEFKDTGAGIDTDGDGKGDSIIKGKSIDVWHDSLDACWAWTGQYGDYVYMSFID